MQGCVRSSRIRFFSKSKKRDFVRFFEVSCQKNVESVQIVTFVHFDIVNGHFHCKTITHIMLYIQHYIKTIHFFLKYNGLAIAVSYTHLTLPTILRV